MHMIVKGAGMIIKMSNYFGVSFTEPNLQIPVTWPLGTYGLPMPTSGCQKGSGFPWHKGYRYHDTENKRGGNSWSKPFHISGPVWRNDMYQKFCMKTQERGTSYDMDWPSGQYCLFKKGTCQKGRPEHFL